MDLSGGALDLPAVSLAGFDFLFCIAFFFGLLSLNLLVALREEGEISREAALADLMAGAGPMVRAVSSVPGLSMVSAFSYGYLRRIPGADVAIGVTAYQLAASTQTAWNRQAAAEQLHRVAQHVGTALGQTIESMENAAENGLGLAPPRHPWSGPCRRQPDRPGWQCDQGGSLGNSQDIGHPADCPGRVVARRSPRGHSRSRRIPT